MSINQPNIRRRFSLRLLLHNFLRNRDNSLSNIKTSLSTNLKPSNFVLLQKSQLLLTYLTLITTITFINKTINPILRRILLGLLHPVWNDIFKWFRRCYVIDQYHSISTFIIRFRDTPETLLTRCVPNLQFHITILNVQWSLYLLKYLNLKSIPIVEM